MRKKREHDENRPKRPQTAFLLYLGEIREKVKKYNTGIVINQSQLIKEAHEMWEEANKSKWEEKLAKAKEEYKIKMAEYRASRRREHNGNLSSSDGDDDEKGSGSNSSEEDKKSKEKKPNKRKSRRARTIKEPCMRKTRQKWKRDENKPKWPKGAFFLYLGEMQENFLKNNPGIAMVELTKKAGEMWKEVEDKSKWKKKVTKAKKKYKIKMVKYKASGGRGRDAKPKASNRKKRKLPRPFKSKEYISSSSSSSE